MVKVAAFIQEGVTKIQVEDATYEGRPGGEKKQMVCKQNIFKRGP